MKWHFAGMWEVIADAVPESETLINWVRGKLAGYKLPKTIVAVPVVIRAANGKASYKWARGIARDNAG